MKFAELMTFWALKDYQIETQELYQQNSEVSVCTGKIWVDAHGRNPKVIVIFTRKLYEVKRLLHADIFHYDGNCFVPSATLRDLEYFVK